MTVSARYVLAALAFGIAALGFLLLPVEADGRTLNNVDGGVGQRVR